MRAIIGRRAGMTNVVVALAIFVTLVTAAQAGSATSVPPPKRTALVIPAGVVAKVCPALLRRLEHSGQLQLTYEGRTVSSRLVRCRFLAENLGTLITVQAIRFSRCSYQYRTYVFVNQLVSWIEQREQAWCV